MAMNNAEQLDAQLAAQQQEIASWDLRGAGEEVRRLHRDLTSTVAEMPAAARRIREEVKNVLSNDALPADHRARVAESRLEDGRVMLGKLRELAVDQAGRIQRGLADGVKPP